MDLFVPVILLNKIIFIMEKININKHEHQSSYSEHLGTWIGLVLLTIMTVSFSSLWTILGELAIVTALFIATSKALVVLEYFMHLKFDPKLYRVMIAVVLGLFVFFMTMLTIDYLTR